MIEVLEVEFTPENINYFYSYEKRRERKDFKTDVSILIRVPGLEKFEIITNKNMDKEPLTK